MTTTNFSIPEIQANQAQKHVTANESFTVIDAAMDRTVISSAIATPPGSPTEGDKYIVAATATGDWLAKENQIACFIDATWIFFTPKEGWEFFDLNTSAMVRFNGTTWTLPAIDSISLSSIDAAFGCGFRIRYLEEELTGLSGASATSTVEFPGVSSAFGCSSRVTTTITGATTFSVGISTSLTRYGNSLAVTAGTTNQGHSSSPPYLAATPIVLTANGSNFTGGAVRVSLVFLEVIAPTS